MKKNFRYPISEKEKAIAEIKKMAGDRHWAITEKNKISSWNGETTFYSAFIDGIGYTDLYASYEEVIEEMKRLVGEKAEEIKKEKQIPGADWGEERISLQQWLELSRMA